MATSVVLGTRPDWTRSTLGIPIDAIVRIHPGSTGAKPDLAYSRNRVSVSRVPGATARPEDEYDVGFVYGPEATHQDVAARSLLPLLRKFVDGYNVAVLAFGSTGSGKTHLLEGSQGKERNVPDGNGLVHIAMDELFKLLTEKAVYVGTVLAEKRRSPSARAFDFFLETSFVELYREEVYDLYRKPQASRTSLQVYEDVTEGYQISGLTYRTVKTANELRTAFNAGRIMRDTTREDVGSVHDRASAIFTVHLAQFSPASGPGEEDRILVSKIQFVDLPGSERLAEDPEILRLREGPILNRALHAFGATLRALAEGPGGGLGPAAAAAAAAASAAAAARYGGPVLTPAAAMVAGAKAGGGILSAAVAGSGVPFVNYEASSLTRLLADALGGNSLCLIAGTIRQADGSSGLQALNTLQYLTIAGAVRNFPIINHGRSRGLIQKLRYRLMAVVEDRQALRDLLDSTPAEGDPNSMALHIAKLRDLEARLLAVRSENAELKEEKQALQARLHKIHKAEAGELEEKEELQEALIQSEEQRLQLSRALIDFQMEYNEARQEWETIKYELETRIIEAEARQQDAVDEEVARVQSERDELEALAAELTKQLAQELQVRLGPEQGAELVPELEKVSTRRVVALLSSAHGGEAAEGEERKTSGGRAGDSESSDALPDHHQQLQDEEADGEGDEEGSPSPPAPSGQVVAAKTAKERDRHIEDLESELNETRKDLEALRGGALGNQVSADEVRETYRRKLHALMRHLSSLGLSVWEGEGQEGTQPRLAPEALFHALQKLADENVKVTEAREADMRHYTDEAMGRLVEVRRKFKALYKAYRDLRHLVEEHWPGPDPPPIIPHEDDIVSGSLEGLIRSEEEADRRTINRLRDQVSQLQGQLEALRLSRGSQEALQGAPMVTSADPRVASPQAPASTVPSSGPKRADSPTFAQDTDKARAVDGGWREGNRATPGTIPARAPATPPSAAMGAQDQTLPVPVIPEDTTLRKMPGDDTFKAGQVIGLPYTEVETVVPANESRTHSAPSPSPSPLLTDTSSAPLPPLVSSRSVMMPSELPATTPRSPTLPPPPPPPAPQPPASVQALRQSEVLLASGAYEGYDGLGKVEAPGSDIYQVGQTLEAESISALMPPPASLVIPEPFPGLPPPSPHSAQGPAVVSELQSQPKSLLPLEVLSSLEPALERLGEGGTVAVEVAPVPGEGGNVERSIMAVETAGMSPVMTGQSGGLTAAHLPGPLLPPSPSLPEQYPHQRLQQREQQQQQPLLSSSPIPPLLPPPQPPPPLSLQSVEGDLPAPEVDPYLQTENQRLKEELVQMKRRLQVVSEVPAVLERENQRLKEEVDSLARNLQAAATAKSADTSKTSPAFTVPANTSNAASEAMIRQLREFNQKKTSELQRRVQQSETRAVMAEEQLEQMQGYMTKASVAYQKEIVRLRSIIGQVEASMGAIKGSYLNLSPLEGVGGGGALRPAASVLEEIASRSGSSSRRVSGQVQTSGGVTTPRASRSGGGSRTPVLGPGTVERPTGGNGGNGVGGAGFGGRAAKADDGGVPHLPAL